MDNRVPYVAKNQVRLSSSGSGARIPFGFEDITLPSDVVLNNRLIDLDSFSSSDVEIQDTSVNDNDGELYTGMYVSTDGVTDRAINTDVSDLDGLETYALRGKVRPVGASITAEIANGASGSYTLTVTPGIWQDFEMGFWDLPPNGPNTVRLGFSNSAGYTAADWSDVYLVNDNTDEVIAHWPLIDSNAADLDGYPCLDASGNGYHGSHTGCAGGSQEPDILQTSGLSFSLGGVDFQNTVYESNFGNSTGGFSVLGVSVITANNDGIGPVGDLRDDCLRIQCWDGLNYGRSILLETGKLYWGSVEVYIPATNVSVTRFSVNAHGNFIDNVVLAGFHRHDSNGDTFNTQGGWVIISGLFTGVADGELTIICTNSNGDIFIDGAGESIYIRNFVIRDALPETILVAPRDTGSTDALGNALTNPRTNNLTNNLVFDNYVKILDDNSLNGIRTFWFAYFHDGEDRVIIEFENGFDIISVASDDLVANFTTFYVNGEAGTTLASGWNTVAAVLSFTFDPSDDLLVTGVHGKVIAYSSVFSNDNIINNHNALGPNWNLDLKHVVISDVETISVWIYFDGSGTYVLNGEVGANQIDVNADGSLTVGNTISGGNALNSGWNVWIDGVLAPTIAAGAVSGVGYHLISVRSIAPFQWSFGYSGWIFIWKRLLSDSEMVNFWNQTKNHWPVSLNTSVTPPEYNLDDSFDPLSP